MAHGGVGELAQGIAQVMNVSSVDDLHRLTGGASRETWMFSADSQRYVMQRVRPGHPGGLGYEPQVLMQAEAVGVPVPQMVFDGSASVALERPFMIVRAVEGETIARKILRDDEFAHARTVLASQLGAAVARTHMVIAEDIPGLPGPDQLELYRTVMDLSLIHI